MAASFFDTHCHLYPDDDLGELVTEARSVDVERILVAGAAVGQTESLLARLQDFDRVYAAVGVHPHEAQDVVDGDLAAYRTWAASAQVCAVGEIGLDYHYEHSPRRRQLEVFSALLELAVETGLPAIVHVREAYEDAEAVLREVLRGEHPFVVHCFSGTTAWAERFLDLGAFLSFTGLITFKTADSVRAALQVVPLDRLMFETDAPYLTPVPHRGRRNRPAYLVHVVERAAAELGISLPDLATRTTKNACRFFDLPQS